MTRPAIPAPGNRVLGSLPTTIFTVMSALAVEHGAVNLGQGFPDEDGPESIRGRAAEALLKESNQYPPMMGLPALRQALGAHAARHYGLTYDWQREIVVTSGGTEALTASILAFLNPGDEAVLIEPAYDSYRPIAEAAGATVRTIALQGPDFALDADALKLAFTPRTRLLVHNSPMNPIGKTFTRAELEAIAALVRTHDAVAVCDEVYEHLTFGGRTHIPLATLPGMRERTVRIGSAGKMFSLTGWKVGWAMGDAPLATLVAKAHQYITFTTAPALQTAVAFGLETQSDFPLALTRALSAKRDRLAAGLVAAGFETLPCEGTYFLTARIPEAARALGDVEFCKAMVKEARVAAIPLSVFYSPDVAPRDLIRFAFCKSDAVLDEAIARLKARYA